MDFISIALLVIAVVVGLPIASMIMVVGLKRRVNQLEYIIKNKGISIPESYGPVLAASEMRVAPEEPRNIYGAPLAAAPTLEAPPMPESKFVLWLKEDWLLKLGALLLLIGFGWFVTYAFLNNWIGPVGRISLGLLAGVGILALGFWRIKNYLHQGGIFIVLGSTTIILTVFAARAVYGFFTPLTALGIMFLASATVALASVKYKSKALALGSLILAGIAPLLTSSNLGDEWLFSYLLAVTLGAIWVVTVTGWRDLTLAALIMVGLYSFPNIFSSGNSTLLLFVYAFAAIFFITNTAGILKNKGEGSAADMITAAANGIFLLSWIVMAASDEWKSLIIVGWMLLFIIAAFVIFQITGKKEPFYIYAGVGVGMLGAATAVELSGAALTIAYTIESGVIALVAYALTRDIEAAENSSWLMVLPIVLALPSLGSSAWNGGVFHEDFFVLLVLALTLFGSGIFFFLERKRNSLQSSFMAKLLIITGSIYAYLIIWLSLHAAIDNRDSATMASLLIYTVIGLACYFYGKFHPSRTFLIYGSSIMGIVVVRLLLVDVWNMALTGKIITFFLVGALLISTAFIGRKKKDQQTNAV